MNDVCLSSIMVVARIRVAATGFGSICKMSWLDISIRGRQRSRRYIYTMVIFRVVGSRISTWLKRLRALLLEY